MRQRLFGIAGNWHGLPFLVWAPQRVLRCMGVGQGFCMGLLLIVARHPTPGLDGADDGLTAGVNVEVLDVTFCWMRFQALDDDRCSP